MGYKKGKYEANTNIPVDALHAKKGHQESKKRTNFTTVKI